MGTRGPKNQDVATVVSVNWWKSRKRVINRRGDSCLRSLLHTLHVLIADERPQLQLSAAE